MKIARKKVKKTEVKKTTVKTASALLIGDTIVEEGSQEKLYMYRATGFPVPCSPFKMHVQVDYQRVWCYDAGMPVDVLVG